MRYSSSVSSERRSQRLCSDDLEDQPGHERAGFLVPVGGVAGTGFQRCDITIGAEAGGAEQGRLLSGGTMPFENRNPLQRDEGQHDSKAEADRRDGDEVARAVRSMRW